MFALGTGIAGLAGSALSLIARVTPTVGQSYIVYAFLVVIVAASAALPERLPRTADWYLLGRRADLHDQSFSDVLLLIAVIAFMQFRPRGIVSQSSRALEEG